MPLKNQSLRRPLIAAALSTISVFVGLFALQIMTFSMPANAGAASTGKSVALSSKAIHPYISPTSNIWYFAEGSVGGGFDEYLTLQNPTPGADTTVAVIYLFQSRPPITVPHFVPGGSRVTISVNRDLGVAVSDPQVPVSTIIQVQHGPGIVAERPMYFNFKGIASGSDALGTTWPAKSFYFPEVDTRQGNSTYYSYITILNPNIHEVATVILTYLTGSCGLTGQPQCPYEKVIIPPLQRGTATPLHFPLFGQFAVSIKSDQRVVVERSTYFKDVIPSAGGLTTGAATITGAKEESTDWLFAEGYTGPNFQEDLILANFNKVLTRALVHLEYGNGATRTIPVEIPPLSHIFFNVNMASGYPGDACAPNPCQPTPVVSAYVQAEHPIVAERLMYFHYGPGGYSGATEIIGEDGTVRHNVYAFAEGYTAGSFREYLTIQNPMGFNQGVLVTLMGNGYILQQTFGILAHSRLTISINDWLVPILLSHPGITPSAFAVSITVETIDPSGHYDPKGCIVAERPMYFNYYGAQGGTDVIGYTGN